MSGPAADNNDSVRDRHSRHSSTNLREYPLSASSGLASLPPHFGGTGAPCDDRAHKVPYRRAVDSRHSSPLSPIQEEALRGAARELVAAMPPLTAEKRHRLRVLLHLDRRAAS